MEDLNLLELQTINETLSLINENTLVLLEKIDKMTEIQFTILVMALTIVILSILYKLILKFIH